MDISGIQYNLFCFLFEKGMGYYVWNFTMQSKKAMANGYSDAGNFCYFTSRQMGKVAQSMH